jgi:outer membrane protein TolC
MIYPGESQRLLRWIVYGLACLGIFSGCANPDHKQQTDEQIYKIIDEKWDANFGPRTNYRISDTKPYPGDIQIDKIPDDFGVLTLPQAVALATAHNREYQTQREELYIRALDLKLSRHTFEYNFFAGAAAGYNRNGEDEAVGAEASLGLNRLLASGTQISLSLTQAWVEVLTGNMRGGLTSILSAAVKQPLLRGANRRVVLENLTQAERDTLYQVRSFNRFRQMFVVSVINQYYNLLKLHDAVNNTNRNYITLVWLCDRVENLAGAGRVPLLEFNEVKQNKLLAQNLYSQAKKEYEQAIDEFKLTLGLSGTVKFEVNDSEFEALKITKMSVPKLSEEQAIQTALHTRFDIANSADAVIDAERKVLVAADSLGAELNLLGSVKALSSDRADRLRMNSLKEEYGIGIEFDLPLDRVAEQNVHRKTLIMLSQQQREYEKTIDTATIEVRQAFRDITEAAARYKVSSEAFDLAENRFNSTFSLLQYGKASTRRVLDAQKDLFETHDEMIQALLDYTIATLNFYRDTGAIQVLPDGMWKV